MSEEFIENIIAASEQAAVPDESNQDGDNSDVVTTDAESGTPTENSSSTPVIASTKNADTIESEDASVAPGVSSDVEELASQLGWNKDHKGEGAVDAATFILRSKDIQQTMKDHNKDLKNKLTGLQGAVNSLKEHNERVYNVEVKRLQVELTKLQKEKDAAIALADVDAVKELDQQIDEVKKDIDAPVPDNAPSENPVYDEWVADNSWYLTDGDMAAYADKVAEQYDGAPLDRVYALVRQRVAEVFPEKFAQPTKEPDQSAAGKSKDAPKGVTVEAPKSPVEAGTNKGITDAFTKADLSTDQLTIMNQFVRSGIMTEDQYIADIAKLQGV